MTLHQIMNGPESPFFAALLGLRDDDEARERYRAWLAERGDERAELFAIEARLMRDDDPEREAHIARAKEILAKSWSVREWWSFVTRTAPIRNCGSSASAARPVRFAYPCPRTWSDLTPTEDAGARDCSTCARRVYLCRSADEAEERARRGECVTIPSTEWNRVASRATAYSTGRPDPIALWADRVFPGERPDE